MLIEHFAAFIWNFYHQNKRDFAWRNTTNPYHILVSEIMLQQTQTHRVITKYEEFIAAFSTLEALAEASLRDVLSMWSGLGYYRRARFLHMLAQKVVAEYAGVLPQDPKILQTLPGIGPNTAGSICAFAFNMPTIFIETNIRTVFIHSFFQDKESVSDKELLPLIEATVDHTNSREWYYALMDYGVFLKSRKTNPSRKSKHYTKQSKFEGSDRQIRAKILKFIVNAGFASRQDILEYTVYSTQSTLSSRFLCARQLNSMLRSSTHGDPGEEQRSWRQDDIPRALEDILQQVQDERGTGFSSSQHINGYYNGPDILRIEKIVAQLVAENFVKTSNGVYFV